MSGVNRNSQLFKYIILQSTIIPSLICDILIFIHFIRHWRKEIVKSPQNHVILCILTLSFIQKIIEVPFLLYYYYWNISIQQNNTFCLLWNWIDYTFLSNPLQILGWFCIERHLFIFHSQLMKKKFYLILFHYLPLMIYLIYTPLFYLHVIIFSNECKNFWDYTILLCGGVCCFNSNSFLMMFDSLFNYALPILIMFFTNLLLFIRIIYQKFKHHHAIEWRRHKSMIIQLSFISFLNLSLILPSLTVTTIQVLWLPTFANNLQLSYFFYLNYFFNQFLPFVIIGSLPEMKKDIQKWFRYFTYNQIRIRPIITNMATIRQTLR